MSAQWRPQEGFRGSHSGDVTHTDGSRYLVLFLAGINSVKKNSLKEVEYDGKKRWSLKSEPYSLEKYKSKLSVK